MDSRWAESRRAVLRRMHVASENTGTATHATQTDLNMLTRQSSSVMLNLRQRPASPALEI